MISFAHPTIDNMKKCVKEIFGNEKLVAERYVSAKHNDMVIDIIGRIDYESNDKIGEAKTKPPTIKRREAKMNTIWHQRSSQQILIQCT